MQVDTLSVLVYVDENISGDFSRDKRTHVEGAPESWKFFGREYTCRVA